MITKGPIRAPFATPFRKVTESGPEPLSHGHGRCVPNERRAVVAGVAAGWIWGPGGVAGEGLTAALAGFRREPGGGAADVLLLPGVPCQSSLGCWKGTRRECQPEGGGCFPSDPDQSLEDHGCRP
jgi:hypothetical protein